MKVMFDSTVGTNFACRNSNCATKQVAKELPKRSEGYSNEEIYNAIMSFKHGLSKIFGKSETNQAKTLNTIA